MKAVLQELKGKYYGTIIKITTNEGFEYDIKLWNSGSYVPSARELELAGLTEKQWVNNEIVTLLDAESREIDQMPAREIYEVCDSHFESRETYALALEMVARLNGDKKNHNILATQ